ncbi:DUF808 domain-containing protein [Polymorphobacter sp. PAMC 29334]|uniref:DUF808 family protein n=1 Tax=Polymorphobacter sp. PAMC 29334 TaxID=2862331 RepID=UPI001C6822A2|nr:DUF808 family protein [Polymorphobacter sp. PAMC 29334]QYE34398.1 DUF808 domain-containing protein [Polymorphobacter sp. PAMC 29334]
MATGLIALLDDVAALAKVAAATLDDTAGLTAKAAVKAAGVVIDDAAVTPTYVVGFAAARELPIVWRIAMGSLRNKLLYLLPAALALSALAPWAITPLLMAGGAYLCVEGVEKLVAAFGVGGEHGAAAEVRDEATLVAGAIRTDLVLSAEIMAITLGTVAAESFLNRAIVLAVVGVGITVLVYGAVALIVKADDAGVALARLRGGAAAPLRVFGRALVSGMPGLLKGLAAVGTAAMLWVGGGIVLHGLAEYGVAGPGDVVHHLAVLAGGLAGPVAEWVAGALGAGVAGVVIGGVIVGGLHAWQARRRH